MNRIEYVIFDVDGVLVDSEDTFKKSCAEALRKYGVLAEYDEFTKYTGMGDNLYIGGVAESHGVPYDIQMREDSYELYGKYAKEMLTVFPWSREVIMKLHDMGIKMAVASSAELYKVAVNLKCVGVNLNVFDTVITGSDIEKKKPAPDIFLEAAKKMGADPLKTVVFEDALSGVKAAKAAGMTAVAVETSFSKNELIGAGADMVVSDLRDAIEIIFENK